MPRLAWLTDIHLDHASADRFEALCLEVEAAAPDAVLVGGDIGEARTVEAILSALAAALPGRPIHFVLGNHDFYRGGVRGVRERVGHLAERVPTLHYLSASAAVPLSPTAGLVGHDGWGDARLGDFGRSDVILMDEYAIEDLRVEEPSDPPGGRRGLRARLEALGDEAAAHLRAVLPEALERFREVVVLTHVPPFREAAWYQGRPSADDWLPRFSCRAVGDVLVEAMDARPDRRMLVLCGHTHGGGEAQIRPNLRVLTGAAEYGRPRLQRVIEVD